MGCRCSKRDDAIAVSATIDVGAVRRQETYRLVAELRSLGVPSGPSSVPRHEDSSIHSVSLAVAGGTPELKEAISKNPALLSFINDHLDLAIIATLSSLSSVRGLLDQAGLTLAAICAAAESLDKENAKGNEAKKKKNRTKAYSEAVGKLKASRAVGDPLAGLDALRSVCERQRSLLAALRRRKHELEKSLGSARKWRKAWNVIFAAGFSVVLASSVVLAAVTSLPAAIAAATASATAMKSVEPWINSLWDEREGLLEGEKDVIQAMRKGGLAVHELESITSRLENLKIDIDAMLEGLDFAIRGEEEKEEMMVKAGIDRIIAKKGEVEEGIERLKERVDCCDGEIWREAAKILEIIMKDM